VGFSINNSVIVHAEFLTSVSDDSETEVPLIHRHIVRVKVTETADGPATDRIVIHPPDGMLAGFMLVSSDGTTSCFDL
jgi:hypothetical protein